MWQGRKLPPLNSCCNCLILQALLGNVIQRSMCCTGPDTTASCSIRWEPFQPSWSYSTWKSSEKPWEGAGLETFLKKGFSCLWISSVDFPMRAESAPISTQSSLTVSPTGFLDTLFLLPTLELSAATILSFTGLSWFGYLFNVSTFSAEPKSGIHKGNFFHNKHNTGGTDQFLSM